MEYYDEKSLKWVGLSISVFYSKQNNNPIINDNNKVNNYPNNNSLAEVWAWLLPDSISTITIIVYYIF